jgi:hypothetical protein
MEGAMTRRVYDREAFLTYQLDLFGSRVAELVQRVNFGTIGLIDAVDLAWEAAIWSGLVDGVGPEVMFMGPRRWRQA